MADDVEYRNRETGMYGVAPCVDEGKPLTPRLHDQRTVEAHRSDGSPWYFDRGVRPPEVSATYLTAVLALGGSASIGFRLPWDLQADR